MSRLRDYDGLQRYWLRLDSVDREAAESVPYEEFTPWAERCLPRF